MPVNWSATHLSDAKPTRLLSARSPPIRELLNHLAHGFLQVVLRPGTTGPVIGITRAVDFEASATTRHLAFNELTQQLSALGDLIEQFARLTDRDAGWSAPSIV